MKTLDEIETRLRSLVEIQLVKFLPGYKSQDKVSRLLSAAMFDGLVTRGNSVRAPNLYSINANPATLLEWTANPQLLQELASALYQAGSEAGFRFSGRINVVTVSDANLPPGEVRVLAAIRTSSLGETRSVKAVKPAGKGTEGEAGQANAFLIMGGSKIIPLEGPVLNIGRRMDNHIVIDDARISRSPCPAAHGPRTLRPVRPGIHRRDVCQRQTHQPDGAAPGGCHHPGRHHADLQPGPARRELLPGKHGAHLRGFRREPHRPPQAGRGARMSGIVVLVLRILLVVALYAFIILLFVTLWREVRQQAALLGMRKTPPLTLSITDGIQPTTVRHFTQPEITIGRQADCECRLEDDSVSTAHARLHYHHGQWWLEDLGSTNGTLLNREKLSLATIVVSGDEIRCGDTLILISSTGNALPENLPA